ncbi:MAG: condensation domain-containing protein, partial [Cyanobacteria bacterium J06632_3]
EDLRAHLQQFLPNYMVPSVFVPLEALPLLPNGKIDRKNLPAPLFDASPRKEALPLTSTEKTLVEIWQTLLNQPVGIHDNFFELGGDSILAIQAIAQAQQSSLYFSPRDLFQHSTIFQLASVAKTQANTQAQQGAIAGAVPLSPIQHWFFGQHLTAPHHWNQSVLLTVSHALQPEILEQALRQLIHHHDALRATFHQTEQGWAQEYKEPLEAVPLKVIQGTVDNASAVITTEAEAIQNSFVLENGPLFKVVYYDLDTTEGTERRLLIVCHHLIVDGISWRIMLGDLQLLYQQLSQSGDQPASSGSASSGKIAQLPPKTTACRDWVQQLDPANFDSERSYWESITTAEVSCIPQDFSAEPNTMATAETISVSLEVSDTERLLKDVPSAYSARIEDLLLTALLLTCASVLDNRDIDNRDLDDRDDLTLRLSLEGHGRPEEQDLSRTVGWLTTLYPILLSLPATTDLGDAIKSVKETLRAIPNQGIGYGVLRYLQPAERDSQNTLEAETPIRFNYLGQTDQLFTSESWLAPATESTGASRSPQDIRDILLEINAVVSRGQLTLHWTYSQARHKPETISSWANLYLQHLNSLIQHCLSAETDSGYSPADFPQMGLEQGELDDLLASLGGEA